MLHSHILSYSIWDLAIELLFLSSAAKGSNGLIFQLVEDILASGVVSVTEAGQTVTGLRILLCRGRG